MWGNACFVVKCSNFRDIWWVLRSQVRGSLIATILLHSICKMSEIVLEVLTKSRIRLYLMLSSFDVQLHVLLYFYHPGVIYFFKKVFQIPEKWTPVATLSMRTIFHCPMFTDVSIKFCVYQSLTSQLFMCAQSNTLSCVNY